MRSGSSTPPSTASRSCPRATAEPAPEVPDSAYLAEVVLSAGADQPVPRLSLTEQVLPRDAQQLELSARAPSAIPVRRAPYR